MKVLVKIEAFGTSIEEEIEVSHRDVMDYEVESFVNDQVTYEYEIIEEEN